MLQYVTPNIGASVTVYNSNNLKRCVLGTKLLMNNNSEPYTIYRMVSLSLTSSDTTRHEIYPHIVFLTVRLWSFQCF